MASNKVEIVLVVVVVSMLLVGGEAQTSCTNVLISMSPCLNYITGNSSTPSSQCCSQLATVVRSSPECLCQVLNGGGSSLGINFNRTQALSLPGACKVQTPAASSCNSASPADAPAGTADTPTTISSGTGSKTVPTTQGDGSSSDGSSIKLSLSLVTFLLAVSYASTLQNILNY